MVDITRVKFLNYFYFCCSNTHFVKMQHKPQKKITLMMVSNFSLILTAKVITACWDKLCESPESGLNRNGFQCWGGDLLQEAEAIRDLVNAVVCIFPRVDLNTLLPALKHTYNGVKGQETREHWQRWLYHVIPQPAKILQMYTTPYHSTNNVSLWVCEGLKKKKQC